MVQLLQRFGSRLAVVAVVLAACNDESIPQTEARDVLDEATADSEAAALTATSIELTTSFTLGKAVHDAATELAAFVGSQLACATIAVADATLTVTYGTKPGNCTYRGQHFTGKHVVKLTKNDSDVVVDHEWDDVADGFVRVNGTAHVTWSAADPSRHVQHDLTWTQLAGGRTGRGTGDRTHRPLASGIAEGIRIDGSRTWTGPAGKWDLTIDGVEARWADPLPQAGTYRLASPNGRSLTLTFSRVDPSTIEVLMVGALRDYRFDVTANGAAAKP
jgi:hypothetical protein